MIPMALATLAVTACVALYRDRPRLAAVCLLAFPCAWIAAAISARVAYPASAARLLLPGVILGIVALAVVVASFARAFLEARIAAIACALLAATAGVGFAFAWRGEDPSTRPLGDAIARDPGLAESVGWAALESGRRRISIEPLLEFRSCSPERFLTIFTGGACRGAEDGVVFAATDSAGAITLDARTAVPDEVFTHLNSFLVLSAENLAGTPSISFSPAPDARIEIVRGQYPFGAPYRLAYLDAHDTFHVVEARSGEKGPFRELASGPLRRGEALTITLWDDDVAYLDVTLMDWSAQVSTALSPTAGWGLPVNAIEFSRSAHRAGSISLFATLAGTSVGRGFDSVGHTPGIYRNRLRITPRR